METYCLTNWKQDNHTKDINKRKKLHSKPDEVNIFNKCSTRDQTQYQLVIHRTVVAVAGSTTIRGKNLEV